MERRSASASNDFNLAFNTMSSGSIAATTSSGFNGVNTDDTDPDLTFLSNLFPLNYGGVNYQARNQNNNVQLLLWQPEGGTIRLPSLSGQNQKSDYDASVSALGKYPYFDQYPMLLAKLELYAPLNNYTYDQLIPSDQALLSRKRQHLLNLNALSFSNAMDNEKENPQNPAHVKLLTYNSEKPSTERSPLEPIKGGGDQVEMLQMELNFKTLVNKALSEKLKALTVRDDAASAAVTSPGDSRIRMPNNYYQLFKDLTRTLNERTQELEDTKSRLEAIVVGLVMNKGSSITTDGTFDPQELAHRITAKLSTLHSENQTLLRMVSRGNKQSLLVELGMLKSENKLLREKLEGFEKGA